MTITLPLDQMTAAEKLSLIQDIWEDIDKCELEKMPLPDWQKEELERIEQRIASGEETLRDWDEVKAELLAELAAKKA